jgi:hypothetical protein
MLGLTDKRTKHLYKNLLRIRRFLVTLFSNNYKHINTSKVNKQPPYKAFSVTQWCLVAFFSNDCQYINPSIVSEHSFPDEGIATGYGMDDLASVAFMARFFFCTTSRLVLGSTHPLILVQGGSNMTGTDLCVNKPHCTAAVRP